jgi:hypothetical protein
MRRWIRAEHGWARPSAPAARRHHFGTSYDELLDEVTFEEEPRRLDEIIQAGQECFDRV